MQDERITYLLDRYKNNTIRREELDELAAYMRRNPDGRVLDGWLHRLWEHPAQPAVRSGAVDELIRAALAQDTHRDRSFQIRKRWVWRVAATLLPLCLGVWFYYTNHGGDGRGEPPAASGQVAVSEKLDTQPIVPGSTKAELILANGTVVPLGEQQENLLARLGGAEGVAAAAETPPMNTVRTPRGGQYHFTLADGTQVWLNAGSSLSFPAVFAGDSREVELHGEAYFEVTGDAGRPFTVSADGTRIRVLGTAFNVRAYGANSPVQTALVEGAVEVSGRSEKVRLAPGQEATVHHGAAGIDVGKADLARVTAWKSGYFLFRGERISEVMDQVARWYDVEVEFRGNVAARKLEGTVSRFADIHTLLESFKLTGTINYKIDERKIIIME